MYKRLRTGRLFTTVVLAATVASMNRVQAQSPNPLPGVYDANTKINYIRTWDATAPEADPNVLITRPLKDAKQVTHYFDGLGRPLQTVVKQGSLQTDPSNPLSSANATDLVSPVVYDALGREQFKYMPFAATDATGIFKTNPFQQQAAFYNTQLNGQAGETNIGSNSLNWAYSKTNYEASPLNRVTDTYAPGSSWVGSEGTSTPHPVSVKYWINTANDDVKIWKVINAAGVPGSGFGTYTIDASNFSGVYPAGTLYKNVSVDEKGNQVIEFRDVEGKVLLKKVQIGTGTGAADDGTGRGNTADWLCTYYIYDDLNNLRCVIQPEGIKTLTTNSWQLTSTLLNEQCFRYEYDQRNRMIMKKVPGSGEVYLVYDNLDRLVMTQDANMRIQNNWLLTKYDNLNRPFETGLINNPIIFTTLLSAAYTSTNYIPSGTYSTLTVSHYDDYTGLPSGLSSYLTTWNGNFSNTDNQHWPYPQMPTQSSATKGMVTWTQTAILSETGGTAGNFLNSVTYYDDKGRVIQAQGTNTTGGTDVTTTQYSWASQPLLTITRQQKNGSPTQEYTVVTRMQYDDLGRVLNIKKSISTTVNGTAVTAPEQQIVSNQYDKLGQLTQKKLGSISSTLGDAGLLNYEYNIRGWLLGINRDYARDANSTKYFGFDLGYDKQNNNLVGGQTYTAAQYNGNIAGMVWKSKGDGENRRYDFSYDAANRLMKADFSQYTSNTFNQTAGVNFNVKTGDGTDPFSAYDANGNIKRMQQWGLKIGGSLQIDDLTYSYYTGSNKLQAVSDAVTTDNKLDDFTDKNNSSTDYGYDKNGNIVTDLNKRMNGAVGLDITTGGGITYNLLNLPSIIKVKNDNGTDKGTITYTYDATGNKLKKTVTEIDNPSNNHTVIRETVYIGSFVYETKNGYIPANGFIGQIPDEDNYTDKLQFTGHEEGRIRCLYYNTSSINTLTGFAFDYMLKDHLGNVRMLLTEEQQTNYYPAATLEGDINNNLTAVGYEKNFYTIDPSYIAPLGNAYGFPAYTVQNNNGIINPYLPANNNGNSTTTSYTTRLYQLNKNTNKTGLGITLRVMAGDKIDIFGKSYYYQSNSGGNGANAAPVVLDFLTGLLGSPMGVTTSTHTDAGTLNSISSINAPISSFISDPARNNTNYPNRPKAFINYIFLDDQFKVVEGNYGFSAINNTPGLKDHYQDLSGLIAKKSGYVYIYVSNESPVNVFFDNLQVVHTRGPILEEGSYYPFGLTINGISSKSLNFGNPENNFKLNNSELNKNFDINQYEFFCRTFDPQIGRWTTADPVPKVVESPYLAFANNPMNVIDPNGADTIRIRKTIVTAISSGYNDGHSDNLKIPTKTSTNTFYDFDITPTGDDSKDIFYYTEVFKILTENGGEITFPGQTKQLNPYSVWASQGVTKGVALYFDGLFTGVRDNYDWESIAKFMEGSDNFKNYMLNHNGNSKVWLDNNSSMEVMEGLMPTAVKSGTGSYLGYVASDISFAQATNRFDYTYTKTVANHLNQMVQHGENAGLLARPYMRSPLTIQEIMSSGKGVPDATFKGGYNWRIPGSFRGSEGLWELGINPKTNVIYHFNFTE